MGISNNTSNTPLDCRAPIHGTWVLFALITASACSTGDKDRSGANLGEGAGGEDAGVPADSGASPDLVDDCADELDGAPCGEGAICLSGECFLSRCGDGFVDVEEDCEDDNDVDGDGCDQDCRYSCDEDIDCDDGFVCNGAETCDVATHRCEAGVLPTAPTSCTTALDTEGLCDEGQCVDPGCGNGILEGLEQCDDGANGDDEDGCRDDCTYTCERDADCSDGDACNGFETCDVELHTCRPGRAPSCEDRNVCTVDSCDPQAEDLASACVHTLIDNDGDGFAPGRCPPGTQGGDCDDNNNTRYPGARELCDGIDNDCDSEVDENVTEVVCMRDADGDGYGDADVTMTACSCPPGYVPPRADGETDCFDSRFGGASVHPGQTEYFGRGYCDGGFLDLPQAPGTIGALPGLRICRDPNFDYNCNEVEEPRTRGPLARRCTVSSTRFGTFCLGSGWVDEVPACGVEGTYRTCTYLPILSIAPEPGSGPISTPPTRGRCLALEREREQECR